MWIVNNKDCIIEIVGKLKIFTVHTLIIWDQEKRQYSNTFLHTQVFQVHVDSLFKRDPACLKLWEQFQSRQLCTHPACCLCWPGLFPHCGDTCRAHFLRCRCVGGAGSGSTHLGTPWCLTSTRLEWELVFAHWFLFHLLALDFLTWCLINFYKFFFFSFSPRLPCFSSIA